MKSPVVAGSAAHPGAVDGQSGNPEREFRRRSR